MCAARHARIDSLRQIPSLEPHHELADFALPLLPLTLLLSSAPPASAFGRETAAARTTVLDLEREYQADQSSLREAFDLPASEAYLDRQQQLGEDWRARLEKFDFASLDPREKAEYLLLRSEVQGLLDETARAKKRLAEIAPLLPFRTTDPRVGNGPPALGTPSTARRRPARSPIWPAPSSKFASICPSRAASRFPRRLPSARRGPCTSCRKC